MDNTLTERNHVIKVSKIDLSIITTSMSVELLNLYEKERCELTEKRFQEVKEVYEYLTNSKFEDLVKMYEKYN